MNEYVQEIKLKVSADKQSIDEAQKQLNGLELFKQGFGNRFKQEFSKFSYNNIGGAIANKLISVGKSFLEGLKNVFTDAWGELDSILSFSKLSNATTRELAFTYGFTGSQAYGYSKAMNLMGYSSMEDLMYANVDEQRKFRELFSKFTQKYTDLYDSGFFEKYQDFQWEMEEFKEDVKFEFLDFIMENKDTIKSAMSALLEIAKGVLSILAWLNKTFGVEKAKVSDAFSGTTRVNNTNVSIDNTFNGVQRQDQNWLTNAGQMTYEQIVRALSGGANA